MTEAFDKNPFLAKHINILPQVITQSSALARGQQEVTIALLDFPSGITTADLSRVTGQTEQSLFFKVKRLLEKGYITREKDDVIYVYYLNPDKLAALLELHLTIERKLKEDKEMCPQNRVKKRRRVYAKRA